MSSKCKRYCSVPQCKTYKSQEISIHSFPKDKELCKKWKIALKIGKPISVAMSVCSKHFQNEDFTIITPHTKIKRLRKGVIPSQNIPVCGDDWTTKEIDQCKRLWLNKEASTSCMDLERENDVRIDVNSFQLPNQSERAMEN